MWTGLVLYFLSIFCASFATDVRTSANHWIDEADLFACRYGSSSCYRVLSLALLADYSMFPRSNLCRNGSLRAEVSREASSSREEVSAVRSSVAFIRLNEPRADTCPRFHLPIRAKCVAG